MNNGKVEFPMKHTLIEVRGAVDFDEKVSLYLNVSRGDGPKTGELARLLRMVAVAPEMHRLLAAFLALSFSPGPSATNAIRAKAAEVLSTISGE